MNMRQLKTNIAHFPLARYSYVSTDPGVMARPILCRSKGKEAVFVFGTSHNGHSPPELAKEGVILFSGMTGAGRVNGNAGLPGSELNLTTPKIFTREIG